MAVAADDGFYLSFIRSFIGKRADYSKYAHIAKKSAEPDFSIHRLPWSNALLAATYASACTFVRNRMCVCLFTLKTCDNYIAPYLRYIT